MATALKIPASTIENMNFEKIEKINQLRRSKIHGEVLVRFPTSQGRDVIQSYAANLAECQGKGGIRMDIRTS